MSDNLPMILNQLGGLPSQNIPQLKSNDILTRVFHTWKLNDLAKISKMECEISQNNLDKLRANADAIIIVTTLGDRIKAEMETVELTQRNLRALVRQEEAKAGIIENEAKKEEFDFFQYMKSVKNED